MRALLVVNPAATTTSARTREVLASALEAELKLEVAHTMHRGHATELAREARGDALDLVVVLGGDGTVNEVVNGLLAEDPGPGVPALGVVPGGGTNVFHRALGLPNDPVEATGAVLAALREGRRRRIGLGQADGRWFTFTAGMGWDAEVVARVDRVRRHRRERSPESTTRPADYIRAAVSQFFLHTDRRHPAITLERPGAEPVTGLHMAIVANTAPWTYLGDRPLVPSPEASFDAGLDIYALTRLRTVGVLGEAARLLRGRPTPDRRGPRRMVHREHDLAELTLRATHPVAVQVDGEALGDREVMRFRSRPGALEVLA
jgi:diacylglycerol kinase family enzyme